MSERMRIAVKTVDLPVLMAIFAVLVAILLPAIVRARATDIAMGRSADMRDMASSLSNYIVASDDFQVAQANQTLNVAAPGVLGNDVDTAGDPLKAVLETDPSHGTLGAFNVDGSFTYTPDAGYVGTDTFTYRAEDVVHPHILSNVAVVTLTIPLFTTISPLSGYDVSPRDALVQGRDGNLYGTTYGTDLAGNINGSVFSITPAGVISSLHSFTTTDGANPWGGLAQGSDGSFYGTTEYGGTGYDGMFTGNGTIFKITPGGVLTTLHLFTGSDGANPQGTLLLARDGNFYGTTARGGAFGYGTVFRLTTAGIFTVLHSFDNSDGAGPVGALAQGSDGNFDGTTNQGGDGLIGTVSRMNPAGDLTTLHSFTGPDGYFPTSGLIQGRDGNFYGTTLATGGVGGGSGTVFKITPSGALTTLHFFTETGTDGYYPYAGLTQASDGNFYGTTLSGGPTGNGTVFS